MESKPLGRAAFRPMFAVPMKMTFLRTSGGIALACAVMHFTAAVAATNTATVQLFCTSVRVEKGRAEMFGQVFFEMEFSSYLNWANPNGEFYNLFSDTPPLNNPTLKMTRSPLEPIPVLQIAGRTGQLIDIEFTRSLSAVSWSSVLAQPLTLTEDNTSIELPAPPSDGGSYQARLLNP